MSAKGQLRHRYFVLTPQYLSFFENETHAAISNEGFMQGLAEPAGSIAAPPEHLGVLVPLSNLREARPDEDVKSLQFRWLLKEPAFLAHADAQLWMKQCAARHQGHMATGRAGSARRVSSRRFLHIERNSPCNGKSASACAATSKNST